MGEVWAAKLTGKLGFEKRVAVKMVLPEYAGDAHYQSMFIDEARLCSRIVHPNVAQVLDVGTHDNLLFVVFEWVEGRSLEDVCLGFEGRGEAVPVPLALRVVAHVASGLHAAHELRDESGAPLGVVHRDVKPQNILVDEQGSAKIIDFGVAMARHRVAEKTRTGLVKGTPQYMSPEHARGEHLDRRSDVWSVGAVLFRMLSGRPPFPKREMLAAFMEGTMDIPELSPDVPQEVRAIVMRTLQLDRADRFPTAADLAFALDDALHRNFTPDSLRDIGALLGRVQGKSTAEGTPTADTATITSADAPPRRQRLQSSDVPTARTPAHHPKTKGQPPNRLSLLIFLGLLVAITIGVVVLVLLVASLK
jgi:serine/threonine-protein kinase